MTGNRALGRPRIFYGWWIVLSFFVINFYWSGIFVTGFTAFFNPWRDTFHLSSGVTSLAFSIQQGMAAIGAVIVGALFDRFGGRALMLIATALGASGLLLLSASSSTWSFFSSFTVLAVGYTIFYAGIGPALAAIWFRRHRGKANGLLLAGSPLGGALAPLLVWIIDSYSWQTAAVTCAVGLVIIGIPTSLVLRHRPEQYGLLPDGDPPRPPDVEDRKSAMSSWLSPRQESERDFTLREAVRSRAFWAISVSHALMIFGLIAVSVHILPHLENQGFSRATGARVVTIVTVLGLASRFGFGWLGDLLSKRVILAVSYILQGLGMLSLALVGSTWSLVLFVIIYGLAAGSYSAVMFALLADYFGRRHIGVIQGVVQAPFIGGAVLGPYLAGLVFDVRGSYTLIFAAFGVAAFLAAPIALKARRPALRMAT